MKFSYSTLGCPYYTFDQMIDLAKKSGYTGIEFRIYNGSVDYHLADEFKPGRIDQTRKLFNSNGIEIACCSSSVRFSLPGKEEQKKQLDLAESYFQVAAGLGCKYVRIFGGPYPVNFTNRKSEPFIVEYRDSIPADKVAGLTKEECDKWIIDGFGIIGELGKKYGVMPLMETHDDFANGETVRKFVDACASDNFGILWDCLHPYRYGLDLRETYLHIAEKVHHVHMKDSKDLTYYGFIPTLVGEGEMDVKTALSILVDNNYDEFISFEWEKLWFPDVEDTEIAVPQFIESIKNML